MQFKQVSAHSAPLECKPGGFAQKPPIKTIEYKQFFDNKSELKQLRHTYKVTRGYDECI